MEASEPSYSAENLEQDFNIFLSYSLEPLSEDLKHITELRNMENTLHDLGSYIATIIQQVLISKASKYKLIHDKSIDLRLQELLEANPDQKDIIHNMIDYKQKIDDIINKTALVFDLAMETWD